MHTPSKASGATEIPVIDIAPFIARDPVRSRRVVQEVKDACESIGFLVLRGHQVPPALVEEVFSQLRAFFALPDEEKLRVEKPKGTDFRGYSPQGVKTIGRDRDATLKPSLHESFAIGPLDIGDGPYFHGEAAGISFRPNLWPERPPALKPALTAYYREMERLAREILSIFADALDVPHSYFLERVARHNSILRVMHYPALHREPQAGEERAAAHTDTTAITILRIDDAPGGLQVQRPGGGWIDVVKVPDTYIVNIGDIMMRWTNDRFVSTMHRVANPPPEVAARAARMSIPYFCMPNYDAVIECVPSCAHEGAKYPPITSGSMLSNRYVKVYSVDPATEAPAESAPSRTQELQ
ncbi:isopenicillin N synthase family oxygenase [Ramlibacter sp. AW1]|uniref:2-oxoglutarate-dependent ethylene/succinate-forming enzyme n=1 Tax=Ramlibacter aurantiacus TaxID=2801330 RepID=A0A936ZQP5_9BURK|nr:isopenicillin N synthase family oxygenase [Ramlibacter aurantiacus]